MAAQTAGTNQADLTFTKTKLSLKEIDNSSWVRQAFFVPVRGEGRYNVNSETKRGQQFSISEMSFRDTAIGGGEAINQYPGWHRNADIRRPSLLFNQGNLSDRIAPDQCFGSGRYYDENIAANQRKIYMQFGVPAFNSLWNYFSMFYDPHLGRMANTGEVQPSLFTRVLTAAMTVVPYVIVPWWSFGIYSYRKIGAAIADIEHRPLSKFYYMKPAMPLYWSTVTNIVNALAVNMKLAQSDDNSNPADLESLAMYLPDCIRSDGGGIDIRMVANRRARMEQAHLKKYRELQAANPNQEDFEKALGDYIKNGKGRVLIPSTRKFGNYITDYKNSAGGLGNKLLSNLFNTDSPNDAAPPVGSTEEESKGLLGLMKSTAAVISDVAAHPMESASKAWTGLMDHAAEYRSFIVGEAFEGSGFVCFNTEYEPTVQERFSNTTKPNDVIQSMNATSSSSRSKIYNFAGGNLSGNAIFSMIGGAIDGVAQLATQGLDLIGLSGLSAIGGRAFADSPEYWESSTTDFPSMSYTVKLRSPYGHKYSILTNIYIPLAMLIAGVAPRSTGRNSYVGPFLCKLWQKGICQHQLAIIESMTITRGVGEPGWSIDDLPLGIDVTFEVKNLSRLMHIPISMDLGIEDYIANSAFAAAGAEYRLPLMDEDSLFSDYMAVLGGVGLMDQYLPNAKGALRKARINQKFRDGLSPERFLSETFNTDGGKLGPIAPFIVRALVG